MIEALEMATDEDRAAAVEVLPGASFQCASLVFAWSTA
jgi:hypothetical protein